MEAEGVVKHHSGAGLSLFESRDVSGGGVSPPDGSAAGPPPSLAPIQKKDVPSSRARGQARDQNPSDTIGFILFSVRELVRDRGPFVL